MSSKMKFSVSIGGLFAGIMFFTTALAQNPSNRSDDEKAIRQHIDKIFQAYMNKDTQTVRQTHSTEWRGFLSFSTRILRGITDYMGDAFTPEFFDERNQWRIIGYTMLDYDIVFHEQTGIVCYIAELFWQNGEEKGSYKLRSVDIYGKEKGEWNQIASNIGPLPSSK